MSSLPDRCRRDGCAQPRVRHSVFCEAHHAEALERFFAPPRTPREPSEVFADAVRTTLFQLDRKIITSDEAPSQIVDEFVYCQTSLGFENFWTAGFALLTDTFAADLLAYCKANPEPRVFASSGEITAVEREREEQAALTAQALLLSILEARCGRAAVAK
jgi:hypothetical protein